MGITILWPLALLILVPAIILLYILKQQAKPQAFSSVMLWQEVYRNLEATKPWEKLRKNLLLFLQILTVILFILAMAGPWVSTLGTSEKQVILVIDNSASMDTLYEGETTRLAAAKQAACSYVDGLAANAKVYVITGNQQSALAIANSSDHLEIKNRINAIEQTAYAGDMSVTLGLVQSCAAQGEESDIVFFTDTAFDAGNLDVSIESFYNDAENLSLDSLTCSVKNGKAEVLALVSNHGSEDITEDVNLYGVYTQEGTAAGITTTDTAGTTQLLAIDSITVPAGDKSSLYLEIPETDLTGMTALKGQLNDEDALAGDNVSWCILEEQQNSSVLLLTESNLFIEKAFSNIAGLDVYRTSDPDAADGSTSYDLYIFDGIVPEQLPATGSFLFINCEPEDGATTGTGTTTGAWFNASSTGENCVLTLQESDVTGYVDGTQIGVNSCRYYEVPSWGTSFVTGTNGSAGFYGIYDGHKTAVLGFDLHQTDFALTAEFPILAADLSEYLTTGSLTSADSYIIGNSTILYGSTAGADINVLQPDGTAQTIPAEEAYGSYYQLTQTGIYRITQNVSGTDASTDSANSIATRTQSVASLFPTSLESQVNSAESMVSEGKAQSVEKHTGALELRKYILILVLLLLVLEFIIYLRQLPRRKKDTRRIGEILLRGVILILTIMALFGFSIKKISRTTTNVFLIDLSDSMNGVTVQEENFVREAIAEMPANNQAGIIVFGSEAKIEQFVTDKKSFTEIQTAVTASATNLEQAVQSALSLFPDDTAKRIVLLTDGEENEGSISNLAASLTQENIEFKVVEYQNEISEEVYVSNVTLPDTISQGDRFQVNVDIYSSDSTQATVSLYSGRTLKGQKDVILQKGNNQLVFTDTGVEAGLRSYRVTVEAEQDTVSVNNSYSAFTTVESVPTILLVEGNDGEAAAFEKILEADNINYETVSPGGVPTEVSELLRYDSVIMLNVYAADLRSGFLNSLETYVRDYAGGLVCLGGDDSYALGNYQNTVLEDMLPVSSELQGEKQVPSIAMVMVIDHSGSMDSSSTGKGRTTCLDVAKNAAINALDSLRTIDKVGVLDFDDSYSWAVPIQNAENLTDIAAKISAIPSGGGTSIYPAVAAAAQELEKTDAAIKHIVLLTDGEDDYHAYDPLFQEMEEQGITLSTVAIGQEADSKTLEWMADSCGGRYYYSDAGTELPRIFAQEVFLSTKSYLINEEFVPTITNSHEIIKGIFDEGSPSLLGYIATTIKPTAIQILKSDRDDPILAVWQYGLGHTISWTSDGSGEWTGNFSGWDNYAALWKNIIDWSMSDTDPGADTLKVDQQANSVVITYETENYGSETKVTAVITDEDGNQRELTLTPVAPGRYQAAEDLTETGVYSISLRNSQGDTIVKSINSAAAMQYSQEYRFADVTSTLKSFLTQINGRTITDPSEVYDTKLQGTLRRTDLTIWLLLAAAILYFLDILCRRMSLDWIRGLRTAAGKPIRAVRLAAANRIDTAKENRQKENRQKEDRQKEAGQEESIPQEGGRQENGQQIPGQTQMPQNIQNREKAAVKQTKRNDNQNNNQKKAQAINTAALLSKKRDREG